MRIALAQLNPTVGDLAGNRRLVEEAAAKAASERADLLLTSEMVLTGYPPMDLLERNPRVLSLASDGTLPLELRAREVKTLHIVLGSGVS